MLFKLVLSQARVNCTVNTSKLRLGKTQVCIFCLNIYGGSYMCVVSESNKYCFLLYSLVSHHVIDLSTDCLILLLIHHVVYRMSGKATVALRAKTQQSFRKHNISYKKNACACLFTMLGFLKCVGVFGEMLCFVKYCCVL